MSGPTCPVGCGMSLGEDRLYAEWYAPQSWWVVYHVKAESVEAFEGAVRAGEEALFVHAYCSRADMPKPAAAIVFRDLRDSER